MESFRQRALNALRYNREEAEKKKRELEWLEHSHNWMCRFWCPIQGYETLTNNIAAYIQAERSLLVGDAGPAIDVLTQIAKGVRQSWLKEFLVCFGDSAAIEKSARQKVLWKNTRELIDGLKQEMGCAH